MKRGAFSLIELMIVVVIIGVVYTLVITNIQKAPLAQKTKLSLKNLKTYLQQFSHENKSVHLVCKDSCQKCAIYSGGKKLKTIKPFLSEKPLVYRYDFFLGAVALEDENCFDFSIDGDGVSDQVIVTYKNKTYDYTPYFSKTKVYDSLTQAADAKEKLIGAVQ